MNNEKGKFIDWHLKLWGESIDASKAKILPMPSEDDDADHDVIQSTVSGAASTKSIAAPSTTKSAVTANPTDHPVRPTKPGAQPTESSTKPQETSADEKPSDTEHEVTTGTESAQASSSTSPSSWVSWLPTFGTKAKIWIYAALGLIVAFCCGLGVYLWVARRRRLRNNPRNNYEFELLDEEETEGLNSAEKGANGGKKTRRTRGGELYDAFAGGSDDDDEFDEYRDRSAERLAGHNPDDEPEHYVVGEESDDDDDDDGHEKQRLSS